jgi:hypothetical protein
MSERYCPTCRSDVEDAGGFCLLGHSLRLQAVTEPSLRELRAEVDRAFEDVRVQVAAVTGEIPVASSAPPPPPPPPPSSVRSAPTATVVDELWANFDEQADSVFDPITAFAPNAHMDWGPSESKSRRFRR